MLKMMRRNVLVDCGEPANAVGAKLIEVPDQFKFIDVEGTILDVGPKCMMFNGSDVGKRVIIGHEKDPERRLSPADSKDYGLMRHWHVICHETKIQMKME